jgi:hypothetical protein
MRVKLFILTGKFITTHIITLKAKKVKWKQTTWNESQKCETRAKIISNESQKRETKAKNPLPFPPRKLSVLSLRLTQAMTIV